MPSRNAERKNVTWELQKLKTGSLKDYTWNKIRNFRTETRIVEMQHFVYDIVSEPQLHFRADVRPTHGSVPRQ